MTLLYARAQVGRAILVMATTINMESDMNDVERNEEVDLIELGSVSEDTKGFPNIEPEVGGDEEP